MMTMSRSLFSSCTPLSSLRSFLHRGEGLFVSSEGTSLRGNLPPRSPAVNPRSGRVSSEKPHSLLLSVVGGRFLCCSLMFALTRVVLVNRLQCSPLFVSGYYQSSALLSVLLSMNKSL